MQKILLSAIILTLLASCSKNPEISQSNNSAISEKIESIIFDVAKKTDQNAAEVFDLGMVVSAPIVKKFNISNTTGSTLTLNFADLQAKVSATTRFSLNLVTSTPCGATIKTNKSCSFDLTLNAVSNESYDAITTNIIDPASRGSNPNFGGMLFSGIKSNDVSSEVPLSSIMRIDRLADSYQVLAGGSVTKRFYIGNIGTANIVTPSVIAPLDGQIIANSCTALASLKPNRTCYFEIKYDSDLAVGKESYNTEITFSSNDPLINTTGVKIDLAITNQPAVIPVVSANFNQVGSIVDLSNDVAKTRIYINNTGSQVLDTSTIGIPAQFTITGSSCPASLKVGKSCFYDLTINTSETANALAVIAPIQIGSSSFGIKAGDPAITNSPNPVTTCSSGFSNISGVCVANAVTASVSVNPISAIKYSNRLSDIIFSGACSTNGQAVNLTVDGMGWSQPCSSLSWSITLPASAFIDRSSVPVSVSHEGAVASTSFAKDIVNPTGSVNEPVLSIDALNVSSFSASGACSENGQMVSLDIADSGTNHVMSSALCLANNWSASGLNLSALLDGAISISGSLSDLIGNSSSFSSSTSKLTSAPPVAINHPAFIYSITRDSTVTVTAQTVNSIYDPETLMWLYDEYLCADEQRPVTSTLVQIISADGTQNYEQTNFTDLFGMSMGSVQQYGVAMNMGSSCGSMDYQVPNYAGSTMTFDGSNRKIDDTGAYFPYEWSGIDTAGDQGFQVTNQSIVKLKDGQVDFMPGANMNNELSFDSINASLRWDKQIQSGSASTFVGDSLTNELFGTGISYDSNDFASPSYGVFRMENGLYKFRNILANPIFDSTTLNFPLINTPSQRPAGLGILYAGKHNGLIYVIARNESLYVDYNYVMFSVNPVNLSVQLISSNLGISIPGIADSFLFKNNKLFYTFQNSSGIYSINWINISDGTVTQLANDVKGSGRTFRVFGDNLVYVRNGQSKVIDLTTLAVQTSVATNIRKAVISNGKLYSLTTTNQLTVKSISGDQTITDLTSQVSSTIRQVTIFDGTLYLLANDGVYYVDPATSSISRIRVISPALSSQDGSFFYAY